MGELIDLSSQIPDSRIPGGIARDAELAAAMAAHVGASDSHPIYLTEVEGDFRYRQTLTKLISGQLSAPDQGGTVNIPHGLDVNKILAVVGRIELTSGQAAFAGSGLPNAGFFLWLASTHIVVTNLVANSFLIRSKPLTLLITHLP